MRKRIGAGRPGRWTTRCATAGFVVAAACLALACSDGSEPAARDDSPPASAEGRLSEPREPSPQEPGRERLARQGEKTYRSVCTACHGLDPTQAGSMGPAIAGASLELLQAKVLRNEYPPGYTPKRETRAMVALPHLEDELPALAAYLERAAEQGDSLQP